MRDIHPMNFTGIPKKLALRLLPNGVLHFAKIIHYARVLRRVSENDEPDLRVLKFLVEPGQCVADIGANIGVYTKYLSEYTGASGRVISIEPIPPTFDILRSNIQKLGLKNVELKNCAVSDVDGEVKMQVPKYDSGGDNFYGAHITTQGPANCTISYVVPTTSVDALLSTAGEVAFIKCDVEGHELNCIRGAKNTIDRCKPAWLIEISGNMDDERSSSYQTHRILKKGGYSAYWFDGVTLKPRRTHTHSVNYFFLTESQLEGLRRKGFPLES
jgi:FkbM family methyltransferase